MNPLPAPTLDKLLQRPDIWRIGQLPTSSRAAIRTGYPSLDHVLPAQGWDRGALTEILSNDQGIGELTLLIPAMRETTQNGGSVMLIAPPYLPFPAAWETQGVVLKHVVIIRAEGQNLLWAAEQAARSGACVMVLAWANNVRRDWNYAALRRLHVAADLGQSALILTRPAMALTEASPAPTRLVASSQAGVLQLRIAKRRGALMAESIQISMHPAHWQTRIHEPKQTGVALQPIQQTSYPNGRHAAYNVTPLPLRRHPAIASITPRTFF